MACSRSLKVCKSSSYMVWCTVGTTVILTSVYSANNEEWFCFLFPVCSILLTQGLKKNFISLLGWLLTVLEKCFGSSLLINFFRLVCLLC